MTPAAPEDPPQPAAPAPLAYAPAARAGALWTPPRWRAALGRLRAHLDGPRAHVVVPALLFVAIASAAGWVWHAQRIAEQRDVAEDTALVTPGVATRFLMMLAEEVRPLRRLARELNREATDERFARVAKAAEQVATSVREVAWVDAGGTVRAVYGADTGDLVAGRTLDGLAGWAEAFQASHEPPRVTLVADRVRGVPSQWISVALAEAGPFRGAVVARLDLRERGAEIFGDGTRELFDIVIHDDRGRIAYTTGPRRGTSAVRSDRPLRLYRADWHLHVQPTAAFVADRRRGAAPLVLAGGLAVALLASLGAAQALRHRRRERVRTVEHLGALAALSRLSAAISDRPGESGDVLADLARVASRLMNMSMSSITRFDGARRTMTVVYRDGLPNPDGRDVYDLSETPCQAECMRTGRPAYFGDTNAPGSPFPRGHMDRFGIRSLILMPLIVGREATGVLMIGDARPRHFSERDLRLVDLWMTQASAVLSNRRLYEGMTQALESQRRVLHQREMLYEVNTRIQHAPSLRDAMRLVAELAPQALDVDACVVCLAHPTPGHIHVAAITPGQATDELSEDMVAECMTCAGVIDGGGLKPVADLDDHPVRGFPHMGSALFVPLTSRGGATGGLLVLLRRARGPFSDEHVRVAELFAARAATKIDGDRLLEQTRRQAETNAILLRELNHRVGNNFAGIIGLLKVAARELPDDARGPLDRAVERVMMMSRAHELFSGGVRSVRLADLVQTTVASVSSSSPPSSSSPSRDAGVRIRVDLHDPAARLFSTRAITLAMVLHELAYNAVEHALGGGGELTVRSRATAGGRVAIDVIDRAAAPALAVGAACERFDANHGNDHDHDHGNGSRGGNGHTGIGLQLVRNLVARELGGRFHLETADSGTTATLEFPLEQESEWAP